MSNFSKGLEENIIARCYTEIYAKGYAESCSKGFAENFVKGYAKGYAQGMANAIARLMESKGWSIEEAMSALLIPEDEHQAYIELVNRK